MPSKYIALLPASAQAHIPLAYVYRLTNKVTGNFYYGYRRKNITHGRTAAEDIGVFYFTSSEYINRKNFHQFDVMVIAEFAEPRDAFTLEQDLLEKSLGNPLLLNRRLQKFFNTTKKFTYPRPAWIGLKIAESRARNNKPLSKDAIENMANAQRRRFQNPDQINRAVTNLMRGWGKKIALAKKVVVINPGVYEIIFLNVREFQRFYGLKRRTAYELSNRDTEEPLKSGIMKGFIVYNGKRWLINR